MITQKSFSAIFTSPAIWNSQQSPSYTISCLAWTLLQNLAINVQLEAYFFACVDYLGCFRHQVAIPCQQRLHKCIYQEKKPFPSYPSFTLCQTWAIRPLELLQILDRNSQHHLPVTNFEPILTLCNFFFSSQVRLRFLLCCVFNPFIIHRQSE